MSEKPLDGACGARKKPARGGGFCEKPAGWGTGHVGSGKCRFHGGSSPSHERKAQKEAAEAAVEMYGLPREVDPHSALLEELARTAGHVSWLGGLVAGMEGEELVGPVGSKGVARDTGLEHHPKAEASIWIRLYQEERAHLARVAKSCIEVGIEEKRIAVARELGLKIAEVIRGVLSDLKIEDSPKVRRAIRSNLAAVEEGAPV